MREIFFKKFKFSVYNTVSFLPHSVSMIMSRHFYRVIFFSLIPCQYDVDMAYYGDEFSIGLAGNSGNTGNVVTVAYDGD